MSISRARFPIFVCLSVHSLDSFSPGSRGLFEPDQGRCSAAIGGGASGFLAVSETKLLLHAPRGAIPMYLRPNANQQSRSAGGASGALPLPLEILEISRETCPHLEVRLPGSHVPCRLFARQARPGRRPIHIVRGNRRQHGWRQGHDRRVAFWNRGKIREFQFQPGRRRNLGLRWRSPFVRATALHPRPHSPRGAPGAGGRQP